jgi:hypothetical protein
MFNISFPTEHCKLPDVPSQLNPDDTGLGTLLDCIINGHKTYAFITKDYIDWTDENNKVNHCKIISQSEADGLTNFFCASHGQDEKECSVLAPKWRFRNGKIEMFVAETTGEDP